MSHKTPDWWYSDARAIPFLLSPISTLYGLAVKYRWHVTKPYCAGIAVICVGNFTMGGAGKTPTALFLAEHLKSMGENPVFLTRGYGGRIQGPHLVDPGSDKSSDVGDEPLLLSRSAATIVSVNRPEGVRFITTLETLSPTVIIMDDGFQNPSLVKDLNIIVVDSQRGIGNGKIFPAGPLRESMYSQIRRADIILTIGGEKNFLFEDAGLKRIHGSLVPKVPNDEWKNTSVIAYTGIASPGKFYKTLNDLGANIIRSFDFPDHHPFSEDDVRQLLNEAELANAQLVTTEKDIVRLDNAVPPFSDLRKKSKAVPIELKLNSNDEVELISLLKSRLDQKRINLR